MVGRGDFTKNGIPDILARDAGGALWIYPSNGNGGLLPRASIGSGRNSMNLIL